MNSKSSYLIVSNNPVWKDAHNKKISETIGDAVHFIEKKGELNIDYLQYLNPTIIFFPYWSYKIDASIYKNFPCIIFHMTDLPFGRGGSPLQNLISRGIYDTKISAIRCSDQLDSGDIYLKESFSLKIGSARELYEKIADIIQFMIIEIIIKKPKPFKQEGEIVLFNRRKPEESNVESLETLDKLFDYIRMLDADGYPHAYVETKHFKLELTGAEKFSDSISAHVKILKK